MEITYLGHSSFKVKTSTATIVTDPFDPAFVGLKFPKLDADIVTVSHHHSDHDAVSFIGNTRKVIDGPGEYEAMSVSVFGYPSFHDYQSGKERGKNTIYVIEADGLRLVHLGDLGHMLSEDQVNAIGDIDVLFIPVGGFYTIGAKEALEIISKIEPKIVIPMHYKRDGLKADIADKINGLDEFVSSGLPKEDLPKLVIKAGNIPEETKICVLEIKN